MKAILLRFALQLLLYAIDGPLRDAVERLIVQYDDEALPGNVKRKTIAKVVDGERRGAGVSKRIVNLAIEAALV